MPLRWGHFQPKLCKRVLSLGLSPFLTYALDSVILIILNSNLQRCGGPGEGDILITCAAIVQSYMLLIAMPMSGITLGCQGVVSFNLGAGNGKRPFGAVLLPVPEKHFCNGDPPVSRTVYGTRRLCGRTLL